MRDRKFDYGDGSIETLPPVIPTKHKATRSCDISMCLCAACNLSKLEKRPTKATKVKNVKEMVL